MDRKTAIGTLAAGLLAVGGAAVIEAATASPYQTLLVVGGIVLIASGVGALIWLLIFPAKDRPEQSTTFKMRGGGTLDLEDVESSADTFVDAEKAKGIRVKRGRHTPSASSPSGGRDHRRPTLDDD